MFILYLSTVMVIDSFFLLKTRFIGLLSKHGEQRIFKTISCFYFYLESEAPMDQVHQLCLRNMITLQQNSADLSQSKENVGTSIYLNRFCRIYHNQKRIPSHQYYLNRFSNKLNLVFTGKGVAMVAKLHGHGALIWNQ